MRTIQQTLIIFFICTGSWLLVDNLYYEMTNKSDLLTYSVQFRHAGKIDSFQGPTERYIKNSNPSLYKEKVHFRTGQYGDILPRGGEGQCKILMVGGSTTETHWVPEKERWPFLVGESESLKDKVTTYNFGVGGYNLHQNTNKYLALLQGLKPNIVVVMHQINDAGKAFNGGYYALESVGLYNSYTVNSTGKSAYGRIREAIFSFMPTTGTLWREFRNRATDQRANSTATVKKIDPKRLQAGLRDYLDRLAILSRIVRSNGATLVLVDQVNRSQEMLSDPDYQSPAKDHLLELIKGKGLSVQEYLDYLASYSTGLTRLAEQEKVSVLAANQLFPKLDQNLYDSIHFTPKGSKVFSKLMVNHLEHLKGTSCW